MLTEFYKPRAYIRDFTVFKTDFVTRNASSLLTVIKILGCDESNYLIRESAKAVHVNLNKYCHKLSEPFLSLVCPGILSSDHYCRLVDTTNYNISSSFCFCRDFGFC